jgi:uncharacterized membrane protein YdbT with pleckstrin-like domain
LSEKGGKEEGLHWVGKPTVLAFYDGLVGGALLIVVSVLLLALPFPSVVWLSVLGVASGILLMFFAFVKAMANTYIITDKCVRREYRFVAVKVDEASFDKITNTVMEQDVVGRVLKFGDVRCDTAGSPFMGVLFKGVKNPAEVKKRIDEKLRKVEGGN